MKKTVFFALQLLSFFLFLVLLMGVYGVIKDVAVSNQEIAFKFGYCFGAVLILSLFFWLNFKLLRFTSKKLQSKIEDNENTNNLK